MELYSDINIMASLLSDLVNEYVNFKIEGKSVKIPYCIVKQPNEKRHLYDMARTTKYSNYAGKGTPQEIRECLYKVATQRGFNLNKATAKNITDFMIKEGTGIDCSGFVYNILNRYLAKSQGIPLEKYLLIYPGIMGKIERFFFSNNRVRKISGTTLTSDLNTTEIHNIQDVRPGDMLRLSPPDWPGKHPVIIVDIDKNYITYAHSSEYAKIQGPHLAKIKIIDFSNGLESQKWLEETFYGENYGKILFNPKKGDSIRRLRLRN